MVGALLFGANGFCVGERVESGAGVVAGKFVPDVASDAAVELTGDCPELRTLNAAKAAASFPVTIR